MRATTLRVLEGTSAPRTRCTSRGGGIPAAQRGLGGTGAPASERAALPARRTSGRRPRGLRSPVTLSQQAPRTHALEVFSPFSCCLRPGANEAPGARLSQQCAGAQWLTSLSGPTHTACAGAVLPPVLVGALSRPRPAAALGPGRALAQCGGDAGTFLPHAFKFSRTRSPGESAPTPLGRVAGASARLLRLAA